MGLNNCAASGIMIMRSEMCLQIYLYLKSKGHQFSLEDLLRLQEMQSNFPGAEIAFCDLLKGYIFSTGLKNRAASCIIIMRSETCL